MQAAQLHAEPGSAPLHGLRPQPTQVARIRQQPEDFKVDEQLAFEPSGEGEHVFVHIEKRNANTRWVAWQLSEFAGIREVDVGYAGRKDRHAVTTQWFSCYLPGDETPDWAALDIEGVRLLATTRHARKLRPGDLSANRFNLLLRCETDAAARADIESRLASLEPEGFPNYFGEQRFGRDEQNLEAADRLLRQRQRIRGDRGIIISAARSALFNQYLSDCLKQGHPGEAQGPLYGRSRDPQPGEESLDETSRAWVEGLRRLKAKADERALIARPDALAWTWQKEGLQLEFELGPGSYATSLLRELFLVEDCAVEVAEAQAS